MTMQQWIEAQSSPEVVINRNFQSIEYSSVYGQRQSAHFGLTWGYYGGIWGGFSNADGTLSLTNTANNYIVVEKSTGSISVSTSNTNWNNSTDYVRVYLLTVASGAVTVIADHRAGPGGLHGGSSTTTVVAIPIACSDETTDLATGTAVTFRMPYALTLTGVRASVTTAPTGAALQVDINASGSTILSTKLTIDASEKTSTTAETPAVISDSSLADDEEITIDIDSVGSTVAGTGLKIYLIGTV